jgi:uncharacterized protein (DUF488 family)
MNELFTIGYSPHTLNSFLNILREYQITALVDVRSYPYSKFKPEFNQESLKSFLKRNNIEYVFLGDYCGARVEDPSCYVNGKVDYKRVAQNNKFKEGLERIIVLMENLCIALMCAEKDPIMCHRAILICRNLLSEKIIIKHILGNGKAEEHRDSENRLLELFNLNLPDFFRSEQQRIEEAYSRQGEMIAYKTSEPSTEDWGQ